MGKRVIGIDFGTTNCCVAYYSGNTVQVIPNIEGSRTTPSVVAFKNNELLVGDVAKRQSLTNKNSISSVKRLIGSDEKISCNGKAYFPEQIVSYIFGYLKYFSDEYLGEATEEAVVTVPAHFNNKQRNALITAAKIAGLKIKKIINEPTAAALAYAIDTKEEEKFLVFDWGGGTLDISILESANDRFHVVANEGDNFLGGDDIDEIIISYMKEKIKEDNPKINLNNDALISQRLKDAAEKAKKELSTARSTTISLPFLTITSDNQPFNFEYVLSRAEFESIASRLIKRAIQILKKTLEESKTSNEEIKKIVLVGGSTRIPYLLNLLEETFTKNKIARNINTDETIAIGAAMQAELLKEESKLRFQLQDITPLSLGIESHLGEMDILIEKNSKIPKKVVKKYSTVEDDQEAVEINIFQGESPVAKENQLLGTLYLDDLPRGKAGSIFIFVEFEINDDGIIIVSVKNKETSKFIETKIHSDNYMKEEIIEKLIIQAREQKDRYAEKAKELDVINEMHKRKDFLKRELETRDLSKKNKDQLSREFNNIQRKLKKNDIKGLKQIKEDFIDKSKI